MSEQWTEGKRDRSARMFALAIQRVIDDENLGYDQKIKYLERINYFIDLMELGKE